MAGEACRAVAAKFSSAAPLSVLPDISPSRGEILKRGRLAPPGIVAKKSAAMPPENLPPWVWDGWQAREGCSGGEQIGG